jgi:oligopeptide transport system ATP-binding protein
MSAPLLAVKHLTTRFGSGTNAVVAVDDVSFQIAAGEVLGLVGESGSGKSATAMSIMGLLGSSGAEVSGSVELEGTDLIKLSEPALRKIRGNRIAMVFQDPMASLNPVLPIGLQIEETLRAHTEMSRKEARQRGIELLQLVGIPSPAARIDEYQHQFSGGMRQRVMIAIALSCEPNLLIADEPTTALDVTIQAQILELIRELQDRMGMAVLLITHDLGVAAGTCDRVNVMYGGRIVESGPVDAIYETSQMPYTAGLIGSTPGVGKRSSTLLKAIKGSPPDLRDRSDRCRFAPRCDFVRDVCTGSEPDLSTRGDRHSSRCFGTETDGWIEKL